ncbi:MAG: YbaB/EbfC family nucleoid-associated protein [Cytophagales bacterium]|nr:MAG: YbaB/EbfC family nucleoid-associated protein [Cytophagales bacterium]
MFNLNNMMGKVKEMQEQMRLAQENLTNIKTTSEAGAGMVKATVNGKKQVIRVEIDPEIIKSDDREMLQDLIVAAINKALDEVEILAQEELRRTTKEILPDIPGLDLKNML